MESKRGFCHCSVESTNIQIFQTCSKGMYFFENFWQMTNVAWKESPTWRFETPQFFLISKPPVGPQQWQAAVYLRLMHLKRWWIFSSQPSYFTIRYTNLLPPFSKNQPRLVWSTGLNWASRPHLQSTQWFSGQWKVLHGLILGEKFLVTNIP